MHIPDGYLSPATAGIFYGIMGPLWYVAGRKTRGLFLMKTVPLMALFSAFCFVVQMLNVPLPGGTTGHAVGAALAAIVLTPWPAVITVSVTLLIQALFFGDGGIITYAANCFNMAVVQVFVSYYAYRIMTFGGRIVPAAAVAACAGTVVAGLLAGIELGIQPWLAKAPDGTPLYAPYPLSVAVPAMFIGHLLAGIPEAFLTVAAIFYIHKNTPEILQLFASKGPPEPAWHHLKKLWLILSVLVVLTPLGLLAPGTPWGEWSSKQLKDMGLGFIPQGIARWEGFWKGLLTDYTVPGLGEKTGYVLSAITGILLITGVFYLLGGLGRGTSSGKK